MLSAIIVAITVASTRYVAVTIFPKDEDYLAFEAILGEALELYQAELYSGELMPNHWQQRFKRFPVQDDDHFLVVCRYVERNAPSPGSCRAEDWRWGPLWRWLQNPASKPPLLSPWPRPRLPNWVDRVNEPLSNAALAAVAVVRSGGNPGDLPRGGNRPRAAAT